MGGGGFGLRDSLATPFLGRVRLGGLYAFSPWIANLGVSFDVGALAKLGVGCELELNAWQGYFVDLGVARVEDKQWMGHAALGYTVFGIEWQQLFSESNPNYALLLEIRLPLGIWWRLIGRKSDERSAAQARQGSAQVLGGPPPTAAGPVRLSAAPPPADPGSTQAPAIASNATERAQVSQALAEAERATQSGDNAAATSALQRAYRLQADPSILLRLAEAELAQGRLLLAANDFQHFLATARTAPARERTAYAQSQLDSILQRLAHLRLELSGPIGDEQIELDGVIEPSALLGYDIALEPGAHTLVVLRAGQRLAQRDFHAAEAELTRIAIDVASAQPAGDH